MATETILNRKALREIIAGKLTYELAPETPADGAA